MPASVWFLLAAITHGSCLVLADVATLVHGNVLHVEFDAVATNEGEVCGLLQHRPEVARRSLVESPQGTVVEGEDAESKTRPRELVHEVYTYGAPATHGRAFVNAARADGCFPGLRVYTEDLWQLPVGAVHFVDAATVSNFYTHARMNTAVLRLGQDSLYAPCGFDGQVELLGHPKWPHLGLPNLPDWIIHLEVAYNARFENMTLHGKSVAEDEPFKSARELIVLSMRSYDETDVLKTAIAEKLIGWRLVQHLVATFEGDEDPVALFQNVGSLACALAFVGTNRVEDVGSALRQYGTDFCGFHDVHAGFRNELWALANASFPSLRPQLQQCSRVVCVGHSLGGALCELFAACVNSGNITDPDFGLLAWTPATPVLMPEYEPTSGEA